MEVSAHLSLKEIKMKFSDNVISRLAQIVQEGMLFGVDVVDLMRQIEVDHVEGSAELELNLDYVKRVRDHHEKMLLEAESLKSERVQPVFTDA